MPEKTQKIHFAMQPWSLNTTTRYLVDKQQASDSSKLYLTAQ